MHQITQIAQRIHVLIKNLLNPHIIRTDQYQKQLQSIYKQTQFVNSIQLLLLNDSTDNVKLMSLIVLKRMVEKQKRNARQIGELLIKILPIYDNYIKTIAECFAVTQNLRYPNGSLFKLFKYIFDQTQINDQFKFKLLYLVIKTIKILYKQQHIRKHDLTSINIEARKFANIFQKYIRNINKYPQQQIYALLDMLMRIINTITTHTKQQILSFPMVKFIIQNIPNKIHKFVKRLYKNVVCLAKQQLLVPTECMRALVMYDDIIKLPYTTANNMATSLLYRGLKKIIKNYSHCSAKQKQQLQKVLNDKFLQQVIRQITQLIIIDGATYQNCKNLLQLLIKQLGQSRLLPLLVVYISPGIKIDLQIPFGIKSSVYRIIRILYPKIKKDFKFQQLFRNVLKYQLKSQMVDCSLKQDILALIYSCIAMDPLQDNDICLFIAKQLQQLIQNQKQYMRLKSKAFDCISRLMYKKQYHQLVIIMMQSCTSSIANCQQLTKAILIKKLAQNINHLSKQQFDIILVRLINFCQIIFKQLQKSSIERVKAITDLLLAMMSKNNQNILLKIVSFTSELVFHKHFYKEDYIKESINACLIYLFRTLNIKQLYIIAIDIQKEIQSIADSIGILGLKYGPQFIIFCQSNNIFYDKHKMINQIVELQEICRQYGQQNIVYDFIQFCTLVIPEQIGDALQIIINRLKKINPIHLSQQVYIRLIFRSKHRINIQEFNWLMNSFKLQITPIYVKYLLKLLSIIDYQQHLSTLTLQDQQNQIQIFKLTKKLNQIALTDHYRNIAIILNQQSKQLQDVNIHWLFKSITFKSQKLVQILLQDLQQFTLQRLRPQIASKTKNLLK